MRYVEARIDDYNREEAYRIYVTKSLQLAPQSKAIKVDYLDMFKEKKPEPSGDEIVLDIFARAGLQFGDTT